MSEIKVKFIHPDLPNEEIILKGYKVEGGDIVKTRTGKSGVWWLQAFLASGMQFRVIIDGEVWEFPRDCNW